MSAESPKWRKPSDIMKVHLKRRFSLKSATGVQRSGGAAQSPVTRSPRSVKRKNPFGCSPKKKCNILCEQSNTECLGDMTHNGGMLFDVLDDNKKKKIPVSTTLISRDLFAAQDLALEKNSPADKPEVKLEHLESYYPQDWCLKMKARFLSSTTFSWCFPLKTVDEVKGMERLVHDCPPLSLKDLDQTGMAKAEFHRCCLYWMHPNIPWLKMFPRIATDSRIGKMSTVLQEKEVIDSLMADWTESFTSAFHLLRAGSCPYFYVCCHQFTVAFFAASANTEIEAVVTPTSRGFREALKGEEIAFMLPLQPQQCTNDKSQSTDSTHGETVQLSYKSEESLSDDINPSVGEEQSDEVLEKDVDRADEDVFDDMEQTDDGAASWLEALGLDKKRFHSLDPNRVRLQRDSFRLIDNRPESTVIVTGQDVQALFNFLLNCRSCVANSGVQAGIPPTLLSPTAFKGATLRTLKVKPNILRQVSAEGHTYSLEITGPILPTAYTRLNNLFTLTQKDYTATYSVHEQTTSFNVRGTNCEKEKENISLDKSLDVKLGKEAVRELKYSEHGFSWTKY